MPINDRRVQRSFTGGVQSPNLDARADLERWQSSLAKEENFVSLPWGGAERSPGTRFVYESLPDSVLLDFAFSDSDGFAIEFGNGTARLFRDYGIVLDGPDPYSFATPFGTVDLPNLYPAQANDVMFIACGRVPIKKLVRNAPTDWVVGPSNFKTGPFLDDNPDDSIRLSTSSSAELEAGVVFPLLSNAPLFSIDQVGALFLIRDSDAAVHGSWQPDTPGYPIDTIIQNGDNFYKCTSTASGNTGENQPVHLFGQRWDGTIDSGAANAGRKWKYLHSGYGVVRITGFTSDQHVTAQVMSYVPDDLFNGGTTRWAEGAWSDKNGYPAAVAFHGDRLLAASTTKQPNTIWASCLDDFENMDPGKGEADRAFSRTLIGNNKTNAIRWMISGKRLAVGTSGDEFVIDSSATREPLTPDNAFIESATDEGSCKVRPVKIGTPVFVSPDGQRVHTLGYDIQSDDYAAPDLTEAAEHITGGGIAAMAWQREPYRVLWAALQGGLLIGLTYRKDQQVQAWHAHPRPGRTRSMCVIPNPDGKRQDLWLRVERELPAGTKSYIECLSPFFNRGDLNVMRANFLDSAATYDGAPITLVEGLDYLEGMTVGILADGQVKLPQVVVDGTVTLDREASIITVGLPYRSKMLSLRYDREFDGGSSSARKRICKSIALDVLNTAGLVVDAGDTDDPNGEIVTPSAGNVMDAPPGLTNGICGPVSVPDDWNVLGQITVMASDPLPATVLSWTPNIQVSS